MGALYLSLEQSVTRILKTVLAQVPVRVRIIVTWIDSTRCHGAQCWQVAFSHFSLNSALTTLVVPQVTGGTPDVATGLALARYPTSLEVVQSRICIHRCAFLFSSCTRVFSLNNLSRRADIVMGFTQFLPFSHFPAVRRSSNSCRSWDLRGLALRQPSLYPQCILTLGLGNVGGLANANSLSPSCLFLDLLRRVSARLMLINALTGS